MNAAIPHKKCAGLHKNLLEIEVNYHIIQELSFIQTEEVLIWHLYTACFRRRRVNKQSGTGERNVTENMFASHSRHHERCCPILFPMELSENSHSSLQETRPNRRTEHRLRNAISKLGNRQIDFCWRMFKQRSHDNNLTIGPLKTTCGGDGDRLLSTSSSSSEFYNKFFSMEFTSPIINSQ